VGEPLIDELLECGGMSAVYGKSGSGKTFNALDIAFHVAAGRPWFGNRATKQGLVIYVAAEGGRGIFKRLAALRKHFEQWENIPLNVVPCPINLFEQGKTSDTAQLMALIREAEAEYGQKCELLVIDTLSRALAGGDENSSQDMGNFIKHLDRMRAALATHLMVVHHAGKDIARGARGWSGIQAALDTEIEIHEGKMRVTKQRDIDPIEPIAFRLKVIAIGARERDGKPVSSCVVEYHVETEFDQPLTHQEEKFYEALQGLAYSDTTNGTLHTAFILEAMKERKIDPFKSLNDGSIKQLLQVLKGKKVIENTKRGQWFIPKESI
jgi:KaiC/GvpD/RAD55 family RecA-like ATPase